MRCRTKWGKKKDKDGERLEETQWVTLNLEYTSIQLPAIPANKQILSSCFSPVAISNPLLGGLYSEDDNP